MPWGVVIDGEGATVYSEELDLPYDSAREFKSELRKKAREKLET